MYSQVQGGDTKKYRLGSGRNIFTLNGPEIGAFPVMWMYNKCCVAF